MSFTGYPTSQLPNFNFTPEGTASVLALPLLTDFFRWRVRSRGRCRGTQKEGPHHCCRVVAGPQTCVLANGKLCALPVSCLPGSRMLNFAKSVHLSKPNLHEEMEYYYLFRMYPQSPPYVLDATLFACFLLSLIRFAISRISYKWVV